MKKIIFITFLMAAFLSTGCSSCNNKKKEVAQDDPNVIVLFDGETFEGWRAYNGTEVPGAWTIEDGAIKINGSGRGEAGAEDGGDIIYDRKFENFELTFEWKVGKGSNSGVFYLAQEIQGQPIYISAPEYQILDNEHHPDAFLGVDGNRQSASLYDMIPASRKMPNLTESGTQQKSLYKRNCCSLPKRRAGAGIPFVDATMARDVG